jgi:predicted transcriptional regulator of viral defense system
MLCISILIQMGRKHSLDAFQDTINDFFNNADAWAFTEFRLYDIIDRSRLKWGLSHDKGVKYIIDYLKKRNLLFTNLFRDKTNKEKEIYSWKTQEDFTVISGLKSDSFFCYYSALYLHGLTQQIPKTFYLNAEHSSDSSGRSDGPDITQEAIDGAFANEQRKSSISYSLNEKKIIITNGKRTGKLGVIKNYNDQQHFHYTDVERTLIDCAVRPVYAGGVFEVLEAFKLGMEQLDVKKMASYINQIDYIYPYDQVIGFYLEKAGYDESTLKLFDKKKEFNFYLTYNIRNKNFSDRWKLFYPKGF